MQAWESNCFANIVRVASVYPHVSLVIFYREMYFSDKGSNSPEGWKIEKSSLTGENRQTLLSQRKNPNIGKPECLSYDYSTDTLFWVDTQNYAVKSYSIQNPSIKVVIQRLTAGINWPGIANFQVRWIVLFLS